MNLHDKIPHVYKPPPYFPLSGQFKGGYPQLYFSGWFSKKENSANQPGSASPSTSQTYKPGLYKEKVKQAELRTKRIMVHPQATPADFEEAFEYEARTKKVAGKARAISRKVDTTFKATKAGVGAVGGVGFSSATMGFIDSDTARDATNQVFDMAFGAAGASMGVVAAKGPVKTVGDYVADRYYPEREYPTPRQDFMRKVENLSSQRHLYDFRGIRREVDLPLSQQTAFYQREADVQASTLRLVREKQK